MDTQINPGKATGSTATVEMYYSSATFSLKIKKDQQSMEFLLDSKKVPYTKYDVCADEAKKAEMFEKSGKKIVPQLFINGEFVGTYEDVQDLEEGGELIKLLNP